MILNLYSILIQHDNQLNWYDNLDCHTESHTSSTDCHTESSTSYGIVLLVQEIVILIVMLVQEIVIPIVMLVQEIVSPKVMPSHRLSCQFISVLLINLKDKHQTINRQSIFNNTRTEAAAQKHFISLLNSRLYISSFKVKSKPLEIILLFLCNYLADQNP